MFVRKLRIERITPAGEAIPCPIAWIDNFAMRNFTNDAVFDDTLPVDDGLLEAGLRVPLERLRTAMEDWFRRKGYLDKDERLRVEKLRIEDSVRSVREFRRRALRPTYRDAACRRRDTFQP